MADEARPSRGPELKRLPTGIAGLDEVLRGGLVRGDSYLVGGEPGAGKTVLGNHLAYNHARAGGVVLFATVLAETHSSMLAHLSGFRFFAPELVAQRVHYLNIYGELSRGGLGGTIELLRRDVREHHATLLVVDGLGLLEEFAPSPREYGRFLQELRTQLAALDCTSVFLADYAGGATEIGTQVDGILLLEDESIGLRNVRLLHAIKIRGVSYLPGRHAFAINEAGIEVYPRVEAVLTRAAPRTVPQQRLAFGIAGLDEMLRGGLFPGTTTLILGAPGAGKTVSGLHFVIEGARRGERGLIASFHETPERLISKAASIGLELGQYVQEGRVRILWHPPLELLVDAWTGELLAALAEHRPQRLFLDGVSDLERLLAIFPDRSGAYLGALTAELRAREVTSVMVAETAAVIGPSVDLTVPSPSLTMDNAILLRYVELRSQLHRLISIIKVRESDYDSSIREFVITDRGVKVSTTFESAEAVLTGVARSATGLEREQEPSG